MDNTTASWPPIPARTSLKPPSISHRRRSLPSRTSVDAAQPSVNRVNVQPASPEVISSLISSLSAISTPAESHFDSLPNIGLSRTAPSSPNTRQTDFPLVTKSGGYVYNRDPYPRSPTRNGFGMDYGAYRNVSDTGEDSLLHPDDAAIAPVVRLSKVPTSAWSQPKARETSPGRPLSPRSQTKVQMDQDVSSVGMLSTEPGPQRSPASIASTSSQGRKSGKRHLKLAKKDSTILLKEKARRKSGYANGEGLGISGKSQTSLVSNGSKTNLAEETIKEVTGAESEQPSAKKEDSNTSASPRTGPLSPVADSKTSPGGIGSGRVIPTRESSLRHSYNGSPSTKKRRSGRHSRYSSAGSKDIKIDLDLIEDNKEEDQVTRRIHELKEQKRRREDEMQSEEVASQTKARSSLAGPQLPPPRVSSDPAARTSVGNVEEVLSKVMDRPTEENDESAPAPAVATCKSKENRRSSGPLTSRAGNIQTTSGKSSLDMQPPPPLIDPPQRRSSSRLKHLSRPTSPTISERHQRSFSSPLSPVGRALMVTEDRPTSADSIDDAVAAYLASPRLTQKIVHPQTGRVIAFSEVGDPNGHVVFCCVGMGLTRYLTAFYDELAWTLKLRLITPDRPGVGESEPCMDGTGTPLGWPDDISVICNHLKVAKFSMLAHSAGAIYALATALRMPQQIRGRLHLLAPWIPPSQMSGIGSHKEPLPSGAVPYSQRILRALPTPILKAANSSFMSATSASITSSLPKSPRRTKRKSIGQQAPAPAPAATETPANNTFTGRRESTYHLQSPPRRYSDGPIARAAADPTDPNSETAIIAAATSTVLDRERQTEYDNRLTHSIWELATTNANPAVDLLICLERRQTIGFRYVDITRAVVIHHGSRDTRVPVENVKWLGKTMKRCEVRILEGEGHGLMASAAVMGNVLVEVAKEWEDWTTVVQGKRESGKISRKMSMKE